MINAYHYTKQNNSVRCDLKEETNLWYRYSVTVSSALNARYLGNNDIIGEYYYPKNQNRAPLSILVHGMGDRSIFPCRLIARTLAKNGIASFILYLVFHTCRIPPSIKGKYPRLTAEQWFESYQISVTDVRQVIDWVEGRPEILKDRISVVGISFGGFISTIAMGLDNRIKAGIFIVSGGNSEKVTRDSFILHWQYRHNKNDYRRNQESYARYLSEVEEKGFENVIAGKNSYLTDPMTFSSSVRNRPILMLNALWDEMIPRTATLDLWQSFGKPSLKWYPATHASIWLWYPLMGRQISGFLKTV